MGLEGYKTEILAGFRLLLDKRPGLISRWTGGTWAGRSNRTWERIGIISPAP